MSMVVGLSSIIIIVVGIIAEFKLFQKMRLPMWYAIIPFWSSYTMAKAVSNKNSKLPISLLAVNLLSAIAIGALSCLVTMQANIQTTSTQAIVNIPGVIPMSLLIFALTIVLTIQSIMLYHRTSKAFGHGTGYTILLILFPLIMTMVLAFGSSTYTSPDELETA